MNVSLPVLILLSIFAVVGAASIFTTIGFVILVEHALKNDDSFDDFNLCP